VSPAISCGGMLKKAHRRCLAPFDLRSRQAALAMERLRPSPRGRFCALQATKQPHHQSTTTEGPRQPTAPVVASPSSLSFVPTRPTSSTEYRYGVCTATLSRRQKTPASPRTRAVADRDALRIPVSDNAEREVRGWLSERVHWTLSFGSLSRLAIWRGQQGEPRTGFHIQIGSAVCIVVLLRPTE
jgi:hypothetical protein